MMEEHKYNQKSGKYEWNTQLMRNRLVDILASIQHGNVKLLPTWMIEPLTDALIENGVSLGTFKVGDIVWVYDPMWGIIPCEVDQPYHCHCGKKGGCTFELGFTEPDIGDIVFATKEEAEIYWHGVPEVSGKNMYLD